jgi:hypothetical protein
MAEEQEVLLESVVLDDMSPNQSRDGLRVEMSYSSDIETILNQWLTECDTNSVSYASRAKTMQSKHVMLGLPTVLIPLLFTAVNAYIGDDDEHGYIVASTGLLLSSVLSSTYAFFSFKTKKDRHDQTSGQYATLARKIRAILSKPAKFRRPADVTLLDMRHEIEQIETTALP